MSNDQRKKRPDGRQSGSPKGNRPSGKKRPSGQRRGGPKGKGKQPPKADQNYGQDEEIRLNKFIAHSGFCSRRDADDYIAAGKVTVNGETVTELGTKVRRSDQVEVEGQTMSLEPFVYVLLNKPKDTITTTDDPRGRDTVMDRIEDATGHRVYPVGRLDRHTMGLLILTNDGDLAHRLMHPSYRVRKTYEVESIPRLTEDQLRDLSQGIELEDGPVQPHRITSTPDGFLLSLFEGRNRLVRRIVEYYGSEVKRLKRIEYAGLTLEDVKMGRWRYLRREEVNALRKLVKLDTLNFNRSDS